MAHPLLLRIAQGEHDQQDFKLRIDNSRKIARTFCAFANTRGGSILIGVKDNGHIGTIDPEEEFYMCQAAAEMYCKPAVKFEHHTWQIGEKTVLEFAVYAADSKPVMCQEEEGTWRAYLRVEDENHLASIVHLKSWERDPENETQPDVFEECELQVLHALRGADLKRINEVVRQTRQPRDRVILALARLMRWGLVQSVYRDQTHQFRLGDSAP